MLLDTDVIIEILRGRYAVRVKLDDLERQRVPVYCTPISWAEVFAGLRPGEELPTEIFFLRRGQLIMDAEIGRRAGGYLLHYGRSHGLEIADALIAASAASSGLQLWTLNRRHFPMKDLSLFLD